MALALPSRQAQLTHGVTSPTGGAQATGTVAAAGGASYDAALDGLRGLAVACVVASQTHVPGLRGGFLGVDVFFVLSGFLITSGLERELLATGHVRLRYFYARRALRLY